VATTFPLPEHRHPVADSEHLIQFVGDEDDGVPLVGHPPDGGHQLLYLAGGEHRSGLVQNEDVRPPVEGFDDFHPLLLPGGELPDAGIGVHVQAVPASELLQPLPGGPFREEEVAGQPQHHVLRHRVGRDQPELLVDHSDAQADGVPGRADVGALALDEDFAFVGVVDAVEDVHQGGLAGTVLAQQGVDFPGAHGQVHVVVGQDAGEALDDAAHLHRRNRCVGHKTSSGQLLYQLRLFKTLCIILANSGWR
jgi:hypothetical protein